MHQLVAQRVQAHEHLVQHPLGILLRQRAMHALARVVERLAPMVGRAAIAARVVQRIPKGLEHVLVIEQYANGAGEHLPHQRGQGLGLVQRAYVGHEVAKRLPLRRAAARALAQVLRIGRVEGDPQTDEGHVVVISCRLGALQPAQCAVHAQGEGGALLGYLGLVAGGECCQRAGHGGRGRHQRLNHFSKVLAIWLKPAGMATVALESSGAWPHFGQASK